MNKLHTQFYLTGGTAISRGYFNHRYSDDLDFFMNANNNFLNELKKSVNEISIQLLHNEGVILLKTKAFRSAYKCFYKITDIDPDIKEAWLNSGFALGKSGNIEGEIECYDKALSKDPKYEKALLNKEIAEKEKKWKPWK